MTTRSVLVVDDDEGMRALIAMALRGICDVRVASNATEALDRVRSDKPDAVLLDSRLPDMAGIELARALRKQPATSSMPIMMITGDSEQRSDVLDDYMRKPFDIDDLRARVERLLARD